MLTRRHFVSALAAVAAAGSLGVGAFVSLKRRLLPSELRPTDLQPLQGANVSLQAIDGGRLRARVVRVEAKAHPSRRGAPATEQISIQLAAADRGAPSGRYRLATEAADYGVLDFTAVGRHGADRRLEAVITRIV